MKFKKGDKVLFLNEKGGGIVTRIIDDEIVYVSIEDGFEIPYVVGDLIKTAHDESNTKTREIFHKTASDPGNQRQSPLQLLTHQTDDITCGIYLAMVPRNQDQVLASAMDFYLVNHSVYTLYFGLFLNKSGHFKGVSSGVAGPSSKHHLGKVERTEIEDWNHSLLQALLYRDGKTEIIPPVASHIVFKPVKIYKEESFAFDPLLHQKAMMVKVHTIG